ncbi:MAG: putative zinc-binding protein [Chloroflexota bacterium]
MVAWPAEEVGVVGCGGTELAEGTVALEAARLVLTELRPGQTVTVSLPLFLTGGQDEHAFAKVHPTVAVDGCAKRCGARALGAYSREPAAEVVVSEVARRFPRLRLLSRRELGPEGLELARHVAEEIVRLVDELRRRPSGSWAARVHPAGGMRSAGGACPCSSGAPPVASLTVAGQRVGLVGLEPIMEDLGEREGVTDEELGSELLRRVKVYNYVLPAQEAAYETALLQEFAAYRAKAKRQR